MIDARGMIVAPGFVDIHPFDRGFANDPTADPGFCRASQRSRSGLTAARRFPRRLSGLGEKQRLATNIIGFVGHATVRERVMGKDFKRHATEEEIDRMAALVEQAMRDGAVGISTGLEYDDGKSSTTEEVIALPRCGRYGRIYMSHVRDEADLAMDAFRKAIRIDAKPGSRSRSPTSSSGTEGVWGKGRRSRSPD